MIASNSSKPATSLSETQQLTCDTGNLLSRKIWLPKALYAVLPYFYVISGTVALLATLYIDNWTWILPHYLFFGAACLHMGIMIYRRRARARDNLN